MPEPLDTTGIADLIVRFDALIETWRTALRRVLVQELTGASPIPLTEVDHGGKTLLVKDGAGLQLPAGDDPGVIFLVAQAGAAAVRIDPPAGGVLRHRLGHTGTAGPWAQVSVTRIGAGEWLLAGDTDAVA